MYNNHMTAYERRVSELEAEGITRSDAQGIADMEFETVEVNEYLEEMHRNFI